MSRGKSKARNAFRKISRSVRQQLLSRHGKKARCHWCDGPMERFPKGYLVGFCETLLTVDHIVPLSKGGSPGIENAVLACAGCNHARNRGYTNKRDAQKEARS